MKQEILSKLVKECTKEYTWWCDRRGNVHESVFDHNKFADMVVNLCLAELKELPCGYRDYRSQIEDSFRQDAIFQIEDKLGVNK